MLSILCKVFKTIGLMLFYASDKKYPALGRAACFVVSIISGMSSGLVSL
jgi:hypothetical protein